MSGGWYCTECGTIHSQLPSGAIHCRRCGALGLRGFDSRKPKRETCPQHPQWRGWSDDVNGSDLARHIRREHGADPNNIHVLPVNDLIEHEEVGDTCACGPTVEPVPRPDGSYGWLISHNSLDGREARETR